MTERDKLIEAKSKEQAEAQQQLEQLVCQSSGCVVTCVCCDWGSSCLQGTEKDELVQAKANELDETHEQMGQLEQQVILIAAIDTPTAHTYTCMPSHITVMFIKKILVCHILYYEVEHDCPIHRQYLYLDMYI